MTEQIPKHGGSAFPCSGYGNWEPQAGMTLRDYFATKAMQSLLLADRFGSDEKEELIKSSFQYADLILKQRLSEGD